MKSPICVLLAVLLAGCAGQNVTVTPPTNGNKTLMTELVAFGSALIALNVACAIEQCSADLTSDIAQGIAMGQADTKLVNGGKLTPVEVAQMLTSLQSFLSQTNVLSQAGVPPADQAYVQIALTSAQDIYNLIVALEPVTPASQAHLEAAVHLQPIKIQLTAQQKDTLNQLQMKLAVAKK